MSRIGIKAAGVLVGAIALSSAACGGGSGNGLGWTPTPRPTATATVTPTATATPPPILSGTPGQGLHFNIIGASVSANRVVTADFTITDSSGIGRMVSQLSLNWTVAALAFDNTFTAEEWSNYITQPKTGTYGTTLQPSADGTGGTYTQTGTGTYTYTFSTPLPAGYNTSALHRVGAWASVNDTTKVSGFDVGADTFDFVPDGTPTSIGRELVTDAACDGCHNNLSFHGGFREKTTLCVTCHTPQLFDPNTVDSSTVTQTAAMNPLTFSKLVHRLHTGTTLPSLVAAQVAGIVGQVYGVVGYMNQETIFAQTELAFAAPGTTAADEVVGITFPQSMENCTTCHTGGAQSDGWYVNPVTVTSCTSCHDNVFFGSTAVPVRMVAHPGGPQANNDLCGNCHVANSGVQFDISITGAHTDPAVATGQRGIDVKVLSVSAAFGASGGNPTFTFTVTNHDDGSVIKPPPTKKGTVIYPQLSSLSATVSGPTTDYRTENVISLTLTTANTAFVSTPGGGYYTATFPNRSATDAWYPSSATINSNAVASYGSSATFALGIQASRTVSFPDTTTTNTEYALNPVFYFSLDTAFQPVPVPRREVVALSNCQSCHVQFGFHGGSRDNPQYCIFCHNPTATDWPMRPKSATVQNGFAGNTNLPATQDGIEERSIDFPRFIHHLHTGVNLTVQPYAIYGYGNSDNDFGQLEFPGDRTVCTTCHIAGTETVDSVPATAAWSISNEGETGASPIQHFGTAKHGPNETQMGPVQAACTGCHDSPATVAHANINTYNGVESCSVCHGEGAVYSVTTVHANQ